jgi:hypothetical protein
MEDMKSIIERMLINFSKLVGCRDEWKTIGQIHA